MRTSTTPANTPGRKPARNIRLNSTDLARYDEMFARVGLHDHAARCRGALTTATSISTDIDASADQLEQLRSKLADDIADGTLSPTDAAAKLADAERAATLAPLAADLAGTAQTRTLRRVRVWLYDRGDTLLTDDLDPIIADAAHHVVELHPATAGITTDADAIGATPDAREAWATTLAHIDTIRAAWALADRLRSDGIAHTLPHPEPDAVYWRWRNLDVLTHPPVSHLAIRDAIVADAQPAALTAAELVDLYVER